MRGIDLIFEQLKDCNPEIPKVVMTYFNPVFKYGIEHFCKQCQSVGVEGIIIPDMPIGLYQASYEEMFKNYGLSPIFLITPQTSEERLKLIDDLSSTFIYAVSSSSTTGKATAGLSEGNTYLSGLKGLGLKHPILVGFNISTSNDLAVVQKFAHGGIIGSAFIKYLGDKSSPVDASKQFVKEITKG